jgi:hypothetical protein
MFPVTSDAYADRYANQAVIIADGYSCLYAADGDVSEVAPLVR